MRRIMVILCLVAAATAPGVRAVSALQSRPTPTTEYVVRQGDTLWGIARAAGLKGDRREAVHRIIELNGLSARPIVPGQILRLPLR